MARLKFLVFVVFTAGLAVAGLSQLSGKMAELSAVQGAERLAWGQTLFETSGRLAQSYRTAALAIAAADPALAETAAGLKDAAPSTLLADPIRKAVTPALERLPAGLRRASFLLVGTEKGVAVIPVDGGAAQVREDKNAFGLTAAGAAGPQGTHVVADGKVFRVAATPLRLLEPGGEKTVGWLGAAFPLDDAFAAEQARDLTMSVTLLASGVAASSLPPAQRAEVGAVKDGNVQFPPPAKLGPVALPVLTGKAPLALAKSFPLDGAEGARVVLVAESATLTTLAGVQKTGLMLLLALLALAIPVLVLLPSGAAAAAPAREPAVSEPRAPAPEELPAGQNPFEPAPVQPAAPPPPPPAPEPLAFAPPPPPAPVAAEPAAPPPDDFPFGAPPPPPPPAPTSNTNPFGAERETQVVPLPAPAAPENIFGEPPPPPAPAEQPFDPFAAAALQSGPVDMPSGEATVTAAVPEELLRAAARPSNPMAVPLPAPATEQTVVSQVPEELLRASTRRPAMPAPANPEEAHFQDVFQQFLATRAQCNEPSDGLTFDKFAVKLRKNKDQLVQKYNCKSVRFQVYVKDGKAALKATPVRDA